MGKRNRRMLLLLNLVLGQSAVVMFLSVMIYMENNPFFRPFAFRGSKEVFLATATILSLASLFLTRELLRLAALEEKLKEREKLALVGQLAAGVAHEIRNPITSVAGFLQLISGMVKKCKSVDKSRMVEYMDIIQEELHRIVRLTNDFLMLAKPSIDDTAPTDVNRVIKEVLSSSALQASAGAISVYTELSDDIPPVNIDPFRLRQVLSNLVINAFQHTSPGGWVTVRTEYQRREKTISIGVIDTGCGISLENMGKIFEPFYTTRSDGVGLGLAISKRIIDDYHGEIQVKSNPGKGTEFTVILPLN